MQWLYFIALKLFGAQKNWCLNQAANAASSPKDMVRKIYRSILGEDCNSTAFINRYRERKQLLQQMFDVEDDAEVIDYIKMTKQHKKDAIRYLTNNTKLEKEAIIDLISVYAQEYTLQELRSILEEVYPDLAAYLDEYSFPGNNWLDAYFTEYRYSKVINRVSPELRETAQQQAVDHDFLKLLPRIAVVDSIPKDGTFLFFVDAMGVEFMYYAENSHPAIIPVEMFEEAQRIMELNRLANKNTHDTPSSHVFTGKIICDKCGKKYKRVTKKGKHSWNCSTFQTYGKSSCHTKQIPEDILMETAAAAMGLEIFDEDAFLESVQEVHVPAFNHLVFCLKDGTKDERVWQDRSRRESWTQEMKQQAAAHAKRRYASE